MPVCGFPGTAGVGEGNTSRPPVRGTWDSGDFDRGNAAPRVPLRFAARPGGAEHFSFGPTRERRVDEPGGREPLARARLPVWLHSRRISAHAFAGAVSR